ncbi:MAG TPA: hypothetical protein VF156_15415 [Agromyces sp.]
MAIAGNKADLYITSTPAVAVTAEACTVMTTGQGAPAANQWWRITNNARRFADPTVAPTVKVGGVTQATNTYTWDPAGGLVKFNSVMGAVTVTVDFSYLPITKVAGAKEWSLDMDTDLLEATTFGDSWKRRVPGVKDATGSFNDWWVDSSFLSQLGTRLGLVLYTDFANNLRYECFGWLKGESISSAVDGLVEDELSFEAEGNVNYATW